ncbi:MAG: DUF4328 domain-containing protein [Candidatus Kryptoniota bacterium]
MAIREKVTYECPECGCEVLKGAEGCVRCGERLEWDGLVMDSVLHAEDGVKPFVSGHQRGLKVERLLVICMILVALTIVFTLTMIGSAAKMRRADELAASQLFVKNSGLIITAILYACARIATGITFLMWIYRTYSNLPVLGAQNPKYTPGSAVSKFLIPIVNIHQPIKVVRELWKQSNISADISFSTERRSSNTQVSSWWTAYLASEIIPWTGMASLFSKDPVQRVITGAWIDILSYILVIVSALFLIRLVREIDDRQERRNKQLVQQVKPAAESRNG